MADVELYKWQEEALKEPGSALWVCEAGTGKTFAANLWLDQFDRWKNPVILCPKQIRAEWKKKRDVPVLTPQTILKEELPENPSAIVVDEADMFASPLFLAKKRSKCATMLYNYIRKYPEADVLLLTATPIRSTPWNIHTLLTYIKRYIEWQKFREWYFYLDTPRYLTRPAWFPKPGWQRMMQPILEKHAVIALMQDMVDYLPPERYEIIHLKEPEYEKNDEWEASKQFVEDHRLEQHNKHLDVKKIGRNFRKVVVVAHYREQIDQLRDQLSRERETFVLDGRTTTPESVIEAAENSSECYFIIQAAVGAGFEIPSFSCMVFASQGYSVRNYVQMKARIRRINALKPVIYYFLHAGRCDKMVYDSIQAGRDFVPSEYKPKQNHGSE